MDRRAYDGAGHHGFRFAETEICECASVHVVQLCDGVRVCVCGGWNEMKRNIGGNEENGCIAHNLQGFPPQNAGKTQRVE